MSPDQMPRNSVRDALAHERHFQETKRCVRKARWWYRQRRNVSHLTWLLPLWCVLFGLFGEDIYLRFSVLGVGIGMWIQHLLQLARDHAEEQRAYWYERSKQPRGLQRER